ncbi:MAG TPA: hypothetical protein VGY56_06100, partial [Verrucomicrobiae bacterium]|nr:hypothetical protein [Verrucomicrobiae bacterium]
MANHRQLSPLYLTFALAFPLQLSASFFSLALPSAAPLCYDSGLQRSHAIFFRAAEFIVPFFDFFALKGEALRMETSQTSRNGKPYLLPERPLNSIDDYIAIGGLEGLKRARSMPR